MISASAATVVAFAVLAGVAPAKTQNIPTSLTSATVQVGSRSTVVLISGAIDSSNNACVKGRTVSAGSFNPDSGLTSGVRQTTTSSAGAFAVEVSRRGSIYKVQVEKSRLPSKGKKRRACARVTRDLAGP
jgi:hypothetical protein